ncbi:MAG: imidazoleglycerol-phosphate dehydratase HisB [Sulfuricurvum sp.]|jgi:imidazoleglycerol-phosphate dehydratase
MVTKSRKTAETDITVSLRVDGSGRSNINSGVGFLDHMLTSLAKHSLMDLEVECKGDTHIDDHHSVEDIGIVLGSLLHSELYPLQGRERFGSASVVMDEACVSTDLDLSNRPYLVYDVDVSGKVGSFDVELAEEFFGSLVTKAGISAHIVMQRGKNKHHIVEATFKSFAVALRRALAKNDRIGIPSTKDLL